MNKKLISIILLFCFCINFFPVFGEELTVENTGVTVSFTDVPPECENYDAIMYLAEAGIINGKSETSFCPDDTLKREEFAKILSIAFKMTNSDGAPLFYDVPAGIWYAPYVQKIVVDGLMQGISDTEFGSGLELTRQDMAVILKRYLDRINISINPNNSVVFDDDAEISDYARDAVTSLSSAKIMEGEDSRWYPQSSAKRKDAAQALYNVINYKKDYEQSLGRMGPLSQYDGPFEVPADDRLAEDMPTPFDAMKWPRQEVLFEDFEDDDYGMLTRIFPAEASFDTQNGYNGGTCIKMESKGTAAMARMVWQAKQGEDVSPGDYIVFSCMLKGEGIEASGYENYRGLLTIRNDKGEWMTESSDSKQSADTDWISVQHIVQIPEVPNDTKLPEFYYIDLGAYINIPSGTAYYDNFSVSKLLFNPMDTILVTPNYKGIVRGENKVADICIRTYFHDMNGRFNINEYELCVQLSDDKREVLHQKKTENMTPVMDMFFSSADLKMNGDYWLDAIVTHKESGEMLQRQSWQIHKRPENFETVIGFDDYGRVTRNGKPMLPIRIYNYREYEDVISDILESGDIDHLLQGSYSWYWEFGEDKELRKLIEKLEEKDITMTIYTGAMLYSLLTERELKERIHKQEDVRGLLSKFVENFRDYPYLFDYYIADEMHGLRYGPEVAWNNQIINSLDLDHPTTTAIATPLPSRPGIYSKSADFLGFDPYPVTGKDDQDLSYVTELITTGKELNPNRPVYAIVQNHYVDYRGDLRGPNKTEYRNMIFQAICAGACMIDSWCYRWLISKPSPDSTKEVVWRNMTDVYKEVQYLEPIILSPEPAPYCEVKGGGEWFNYMTKRYEGKSYLFAVNNQMEGKMARIYLDGVSSIRGMYSGEVYEADDFGWFELNMDALEVEVFEYEQDDYKSPHAELKRFGFEDIFISSPADDASTVLVPEGTQELTYRASISENAQLYINGEPVEEVGTINIENISEINVKVVSEDGRFEALKTYRLQIQQEVK